MSDGGIQIEGTKSIETGTQVLIDLPQYGFPLKAVVRHSTPAGMGFSIGLEFCSETLQSMRTSKKDLDHYEVLQLSGLPERVPGIHLLVSEREGVHQEGRLLRFRTDCDGRRLCRRAYAGAKRAPSPDRIRSTQPLPVNRWDGSRETDERSVGLL